MKLKNKTDLANTLFMEGYDSLAFWGDGTWERTSLGYSYPENPPEFLFCRSYFYNRSKRECRTMVKALEIAIQKGTSVWDEYTKLGGE